MEELIAQLIGFVSSIIIILSFQFNNRKIILILSAASLAIFSVHLLLLGAYTGAVVVFLGVIRLWVFFQKFRNSSKLFTALHGLWDCL